MSYTLCKCVLNKINIGGLDLVTALSNTDALDSILKMLDKNQNRAAVVLQCLVRQFQARAIQRRYDTAFRVRRAGLTHCAWKSNRKKLSRTVVGRWAKRKRRTVSRVFHGWKSYTKHVSTEKKRVNHQVHYCP
jgi:hypothetical protein